MEDLIQFNIKGISYSQTQTGAYALILEEENGRRTLPIVIGGLEAQSIALALEKDLRTPRPLTHDLFVNVINQYNIKISAVYIHRLEDGIFYSNISFLDQGGKETIVDSRTSDAIALAIRMQAPIFAYNSVVKKAGIILKQDNQDKKATTKTLQEIEKKSSQHQEKTQQWADKSLKELKELMEKAVQNEDYELAARLRDEIDNR